MKKNIGIAELLRVLSAKPGMPLRFYLEGISIHQGYHVTEVKYATIKSMDCGKQLSALDELLIQLLDGKENSSQGFMSTCKFTGIIKAALESLPEYFTSSLYFEFTPDNGPLQKLNVHAIDCNDREMTIHLGHDQAACKPFQRWGVMGSVLESAHSKVTESGCCSGRARC